MLRKRAHRSQENSSMKRINSKEEVIPRGGKGKGGHDPDRCSTATIQSNGSSPSSLKERKHYGMKDFEELLRNEGFQKKALLRLSQSRSSESLECLIEIFKWEIEDNEENRIKISKMIIETFVKTQSTKEVCLPCSLKTKVVESQKDENIVEMKTFLIRDLRFNDSLLSIVDS